NYLIYWNVVNAKFSDCTSRRVSRGFAMRLAKPASLLRTSVTSTSGHKRPTDAAASPSWLTTARSCISESQHHGAWEVPVMHGVAGGVPWRHRRAPAGEKKGRTVVCQQQLGASAVRYLMLLPYQPPSFTQCRCLFQDSRQEPSNLHCSFGRPRHRLS